MELTQFCQDHLGDIEVIAALVGWGLGMLTTLVFSKVVE